MFAKGIYPRTLNYIISSSSGSFSTTSGTYVDVTNLSVSITTTGGLVYMGLIPDGSGSVSYVGSTRSGASSSAAQFRFDYDSGTQLTDHEVNIFTSGSTTANIEYPVGSIWFIHATPSVGVHTYKLRAKASPSSTATVLNAKLIVYEFPVVQT